MGLPSPHPSALFTLKPLNLAAQDVVNNPDHQQLVSVLESEDKQRVLGLDIGPRVSSMSRQCLAKLGRARDCDIAILGRHISSVQCDFHVLDNGMVMLRDQSSFGTTQIVPGEDDKSHPTPFELGRSRQVVVLPGKNTTFKIGASEDGAMFELIWHGNAREKLKSQLGDLYGTESDDRRARTEPEPDLAPTVAPTRPTTRIHTPPRGSLPIRYHPIEQIGSGAYGVVWRAVDMDTGRLIALKVICVERKSWRQPHGGAAWEAEHEWRNRWDNRYQTIKREIEILSRLSHPHIVEYLAKEVDSPAATVNILTDLMDGPLESLLSDMNDDIVACVLQHMLSALDYLASQKPSLIHRDVKPANILFKRLSNGELLFQLADFGLSHNEINAVTICGTRAFAAPELFFSGPQTPKMDIWSLFVTMVCVLDINNFRTTDWERVYPNDIFYAMLKAAEHRDMRRFKSMAVVKPEGRPSAAQLLSHFFPEQGISKEPTFPNFQQGFQQPGQMAHPVEAPPQSNLIAREGTFHYQGQQNAVRGSHSSKSRRRHRGNTRAGTPKSRNRSRHSSRREKSQAMRSVTMQDAYP
ncbi:serine/threonine protein kinase [Polytolypa hystricis UAMH7299]|uniref:non-specific serine/threonine protein kinase n=1 Tax=Polytolypa hystricis (strain UAMH7299) TaxID=1447883 RepID=A0A2B7YF66_POLH7|nr:serine/threonine protein kinase [Polytolypa hystricis UAMH7299]